MSRRPSAPAPLTLFTALALFLAFGCTTRVILGYDDGGPAACASAGGTCLTGAAVSCAGTILASYDCRAAGDSAGAICCLTASTMDAGPDGGMDAGSDAGSDAGLDAGPDAGFDGGVDAGIDAGPDAGIIYLDPDAGPTPICPPVTDAGSCTPGTASNLAATATYGSHSYAILASSDLNGDGLLDLVAVVAVPSEAPDTGFDVFLARSDGGFDAPTLYPGADGEAVAVGDVDGDGRPDVLVSDGTMINVFVNDGLGGLVQHASLSTDRWGTHAIGIADFNRDGFSDLVLGEYSHGAVMIEVLYGSASGWVSPPAILPVGSPDTADPEILLVADLDLDGLPDIVTSDYPSANDPFKPSNDPPMLAVLMNQGDGGFQVTSYPVFFNNVALMPLAGRPPDVVVASEPDPLNLSDALNLSDVQLLQNLCGGTFRLGHAYEVRGAGHIAVGDFNGDCIPDVAGSGGATCTDAGSGIDLLYGDGKGGFQPAQSVGPSGAPAAGALAPLGPVNNPDAIAAANSCGAGITVYGDPGIE